MGLWRSASRCLEARFAHSYDTLLRFQLDGARAREFKREETRLANASQPVDLEGAFEGRFCHTLTSDLRLV
jgi:hypothetical protein